MLTAAVAGVSCGCLSVWRCGGSGEAAGLYPGQQRRATVHTGAHAKKPLVASRSKGEVSGLVWTPGGEAGTLGPLDSEAESLWLVVASHYRRNHGRTPFLQHYHARWEFSKILYYLCPKSSLSIVYIFEQRKSSQAKIVIPGEDSDGSYVWCSLVCPILVVWPLEPRQFNLQRMKWCALCSSLIIWIGIRIRRCAGWRWREERILWNQSMTLCEQD